MIFDSEQLDAVTAGDPELAREVLDLYRDDARDLVGRLRAAADGGQEPEVVRLAHTLKSSSGSVGARQASGLAARIEAEGLGAARELVPDLEAAVEQAIAAITAHVGASAPAR